MAVRDQVPARLGTNIGGVALAAGDSLALLDLLLQFFQPPQRRERAGLVHERQGLAGRLQLEPPCLFQGFIPTAELVVRVHEPAQHQHPENAKGTRNAL